MIKITGDELRGHLATLVLSVIARGEAHGYEVLRRIEDAGSGALALKEGTLYPALYRLEQAGLVSARWESGKDTRRGPRRRIYRITSKGSRQLESSRQSWRNFVRVIDSIVEA
ncbi:MAG: helix-turn-helix transcriptional regulator [Candidatus Hydrogenedentes bacterium]|nr:helix-turn-helix transcriptional regulator [Candidatus Hydrogenedentota bacterium]